MDVIHIFLFSTRENHMRNGASVNDEAAYGLDSDYYLPILAGCEIDLMPDAHSQKNLNGFLDLNCMSFQGR